MSEITQIKLDAIEPSPRNPRKCITKESLADLAVSIGAHGVLQPILVRPHPDWDKKSKRYELVAGERRWRASAIAGVKLIPVIVRELTDVEVSEIQVIENEQREDLSALEKAAGYKQHIEEFNVKVEDLAAKIGKSAGTIYGLLKLLQLPKDALDDLKRGELLPGVATMIARVPNAELRQQAYEAVQEELNYGDGCVSVRVAKSIIEHNFMVELKGTPFDQADADLTEAGPCTRCPKKTGNNRAEYPDGRADICTDPSCFAEKKKAHQERLLVKVKAEGKPVLAAVDAAKLFTGYQGTSLGSNGEWIDLKDKFYSNRGSRYDGKSYQEVLGKTIKEDVVYAQDKEGTLHELVPRKRADAILKEKPGMPAGKSSASENGWKAEQAAARKKQQKENEVARREIEAVHNVAHALATKNAFTPAMVNALYQLALVMTGEVWHEIKKQVCKRRELERKASDSFEKLLKSHVGTLDGPRLFAYLVELAATRVLLHGHYNPMTTKADFLKAFPMASAVAAVPR